MIEENYNHIYNLNSNEWNNIFIYHINQFGFHKQLTKLIEECGELVKALCKSIGNEENDRNDNYRLRYNLHEEILDVWIMSTQFKKIYLDNFLVETITKEIETELGDYYLNTWDLTLLLWLSKLIKVSTEIKLNAMKGYNDSNSYRFHETISYVHYLVEMYKDKFLEEKKVKKIMIKKYTKACVRVGIIP